EQVKVTLDNVLAVLSKARSKSDAKRDDRRRQLRMIIYPRFDFSEMARRSLGSQWRRLTPEEQKDFVEIFTDLLENAYVSKIESYTDEKLVYVRETEEKEFAQVDTKILTRKGEEFSLIYKLHLVNGEWKVYDVVVENISLVNNYRSQFNRVIANSSYEELVRRLKDKRIQLAR
ncbi:MAG: MlaC/ttg2D family ABC transporter substrate-binding protein, partial [Candidatus Binatia bacterium]